MLRFEPNDIIIILIVAFLLFGGISRLPETTRAIGKAIREFRFALAGKETDANTKTPPKTSTDSSTKPS
jgi:TatA/E family protein of Tat protein translocase